MRQFQVNPKGEAQIHLELSCVLLVNTPRGWVYPQTTVYVWVGQV